MIHPSGLRFPSCSSSLFPGVWYQNVLILNYRFCRFAEICLVYFLKFPQRPAGWFWLHMWRRSKQNLKVSILFFLYLVSFDLMLFGIIGRRRWTGTQFKPRQWPWGGRETLCSFVYRIYSIRIIDQVKKRITASFVCCRLVFNAFITKQRTNLVFCVGIFRLACLLLVSSCCTSVLAGTISQLLLAELVHADRKRLDGPLLHLYYSLLSPQRFRCWDPKCSQRLNYI